MTRKIVIQNKYHKKLSFESLLGRPFSMNGKEIRTVDYDMGIKLLENIWVVEVGKEPKISISSDTETKDIEIIEEKIKEEIINKKGRQAIVKDKKL